MKQLNFEPRKIGRGDVSRKEQIIAAYENMIDAAIGVQMEIETCLKNLEGFGLDFFMEAIKGDTELFIRKKFIELNNVSIPGINTEKLMQSDLLDIVNIQEAVKERQRFDNAWKEVQKTRFIYPLRKLNIDGEYEWGLTEDFYQELEKATFHWTQSEQQNQVLEKIEQFCSILNDLVELKILRQNHGINEFNILTSFVNFDRRDENKPFSVASGLFYRPRLVQYRAGRIPEPVKDFKDFVS